MFGGPKLLRAFNVHISDSKVNHPLYKLLLKLIVSGSDEAGSHLWAGCPLRADDASSLDPQAPQARLGPVQLQGQEAESRGRGRGRPQSLRHEANASVQLQPPGGVPQPKVRWKSGR